MKRALVRFYIKGKFSIVKGKNFQHVHLTGAALVMVKNVFYFIHFT